jgi:2-methylisoborneol synthase
MVSLLSRMAASEASHELADLVTALLSSPERPARQQLVPAQRRVLGGPTGLGTSAARIRPPQAAMPTATGKRPDAGSSVPELHCPPALRDNPALGDEVNQRLVAWAEELGIFHDRLDQLRDTNFGRLAMLTHPDTDEPDRLLAAAKCALAEWAVDDYYCDDESVGATPELLGSRLSVAVGVVDPAQLPDRYAPDLRAAIQEDPVLGGLRSALEHLSRYAAPSQLHRLRHEIANLFVGFNAEADWRTAGRMPPVWEYLTARQQNSFLPCMTVIDAIGGYQLPVEEYADPRVRRTVAMAGTASTLLNDLYSMSREQHASGTDFNLPTVIAAEEGCSLNEAVKRSVEIHDELVYAFEREAAALSLTGSPALRRFLAGVWAWLGGNREWHSGSARYHGEQVRGE